LEQLEDMSVQDFPFAALLAKVMDRFPRDSRWAVTCGSALALNGVDYKPTDLDFFGPIDDIKRIVRSKTGFEEVFPCEWRKNETFDSYFGRWLIDGVDVDFVGDFSLCCSGKWLRWDEFHPCWSRLSYTDVLGRRIQRDTVSGGNIVDHDLLRHPLALPDIYRSPKRAPPGSEPPLRKSS